MPLFMIASITAKTICLIVIIVVLELHQYYLPVLPLPLLLKPIKNYYYDKYHEGLRASKRIP